MDRREFLRTVGIAGGTALAASSATAAESKDSALEFRSVLVDLQRCIGCRKCEAACAAENGLPIPENLEDPSIFDEIRDTTTDEWTVVNRYQTDVGEVFVKKQCMHCNQAGCSTACLTRAMYKTKEGPVIWRESKCMGCRFCMVSCPFDIPRFEYDSAVPKIQKCIMCWERLKEGEQPACVQVCPVDALQFGYRRQIVDLARGRIYDNPWLYEHHIFGEHEVGGTAWLYISPVPFDQLGFRTYLDNEPVPALTQSFLYSVPVVFLLWPAFLSSLRQARISERSAAQAESDHESGGES